MKLVKLGYFVPYQTTKCCHSLMETIPLLNNNKTSVISIKFLEYWYSGEHTGEGHQFINRENVQITNRRRLPIPIWTNTKSEWVLRWWICLRQWEMRCTKSKMQSARRLRRRHRRRLPGASELFNLQERIKLYWGWGRGRLLLSSWILGAQLSASVGCEVQLAVQRQELSPAEEQSCFPSRCHGRPLRGLLSIRLQ